LLILGSACTVKTYNFAPDKAQRTTTTTIYQTKSRFSKLKSTAVIIPKHRADQTKICKNKIKRDAPWSTSFFVGSHSVQFTGALCPGSVVTISPLCSHEHEFGQIGWHESGINFQVTKTAGKKMTKERGGRPGERRGRRRSGCRRRRDRRLPTRRCSPRGCSRRLWRPSAPPRPCPLCGHQRAALRRPATSRAEPGSPQRSRKGTALRAAIDDQGVIRLHHPRRCRWS